MRSWAVVSLFLLFVSGLVVWPLLTVRALEVGGLAWVVREGLPLVRLAHQARAPEQVLVLVLVLGLVAAQLLGVAVVRLLDTIFVP